MKWVVTGGAGFIGSRLVFQLLDMGEQVVIIDSFSNLLYPSLDKRERVQRAQSAHPHLLVFDLDIAREIPTSCIEGADVVVHLAALPGTGDSWSNIRAYVEANEVSTWNLLRALEASSDESPHLVHVSTSSVYGNFTGDSEDAPLKPLSPYGVSKAAAELAVASYSQWIDKITVLRLFSVYGPGQRPDMAYAKFIKAIRDGNEILVTGDGRQTRTNTFVDDVTSAILEVVYKRIYGTFNVCGIETYPLTDIIHQIQEIMGQRARVQFVNSRRGDQQDIKARPLTLMSQSDWYPKMDLATGLKLQIDAS